MPINYTLYGKRNDQAIERTGTLSEAELQGVDVDQDTALINVAVRDLRARGTNAEWESCTLEHTETQQIRTYIRYKKRWTLPKTQQPQSQNTQPPQSSL